MKTVKEIIEKSNLTKKEKEVATKYGISYLYEGVTLRPTYYLGSKKRTRLYTSSVVTKQIIDLKATGLFEVTFGNDAARGSATGDYVTFVPKRKRLLVKKAFIQMLTEKEEALRIEREEAEKHNAEVSAKARMQTFAALDALKPQIMSDNVDLTRKSSAWYVCQKYDLDCDMSDVAAWIATQK